VDYAFNLSWWEARDLLSAGAWVRRWDWTDRWWFKTAALTWVVPEGGEARVLLASDITRTEILARDWTTMWPDQQPCIVDPPPPVDPPPNPPPEPPKPPPPVPNPNPGGSARQHYEYFLRPPSSSSAALYGIRSVVNPFTAPSSVHITGKADGVLVINGIAVAAPPDAFSPAIIDHTFLLASGETFVFGTRISGNGDTGYNLTFTFTA